MVDKESNSIYGKVGMCSVEDINNRAQGKGVSAGPNPKKEKGSPRED